MVVAHATTAWRLPMDMGEGQLFCPLSSDCLASTCGIFGLWSPLHAAYFLEGQVNNLLGRVRHVTHYLG
jgi:hypothetical protein